MKKLFFALALVAVAGVANAASKSVGPAGCGLGNVVFGNDSQVLASTTNGSSGSQTFGITSGTSNCVDGGGSAMLMNYIENNKVALTKEAARGEGETVAGLSKMMGCGNAKQFGASMKSHYEEIFPNADTGAAHVTTELRRMLKEDKALATQCAPIS